jgi:hypothetical protein
MFLAIDTLAILSPFAKDLLFLELQLYGCYFVSLTCFFLLLFTSEICSALWNIIWYVRKRADPEMNAISQNQIWFKTKKCIRFLVYVDLTVQLCHFQ